MKDYTDFLNAPDEPDVKDFSDFLNAPDEPRRVETKGSTFKQYDPSGSLISRLFGKYAPDVLDVIGGAVSTMKGAVNTVSPGSVTNTGIASELGLPYDADPSSNAYLAGQIVDPAALALGGLAGKGVQALPAVSKGYKAARAVTAGKNVPMTAEGVLRLGAAGAGAGAGTAYLASEGDLTAAGEGGVVGGAISTALPITGKVAQGTFGWATDFAKNRLGQVKAGQIAREVAGENLPAIRTAMQNAAPDLTAGQAAYGINQEPWQALGAAAQKADPYSYYGPLAAREAQNRVGMLTGVTPDLTAAEAKRTAQMATDMGTARASANLSRIGRETPLLPPKPVVTEVPSPLQPGMKTQVVKAGEIPKNLPGIPGIEPLKENPIFRALMSDAKRMAESKVGLPYYLQRLTKDQLDDIVKDPTKSLEGIQMMKAALDAKFSKTPLKDSALDAFYDEDITKIKLAMFGKSGKNGQVGAVDKAIPEYGTARANYAANSAPINQANVLEQVRRKLVNPLDEGKERAGVFLAGLDRGEESVLKAAGLNTRFNDSIEAALTPAQFRTVNQIADELVRNEAIKGQAGRGMETMERVVGDSLGKQLKLPGYMAAPVTTTNKIIEVLTGKVNRQTIEAISKGMQSGKTALEMLNTLPTAEKNRVLMALGQAGQLAPAAAGVTGATMSNKP